MAGIINIALKQNVDLGLSGALNLGVSTSTAFNGSGNVGYQSGPWTSFVNAGIVRDERTVDGINDRERYDAVRNLLSATDQDVNTTMNQRGQNLNATVDYKINARDVLSNALLFNHRGSGDRSMNAYSELERLRRASRQLCASAPGGREGLDDRLRRLAQAHLQAEEARAV